MAEFDMYSQSSASSSPEDTDIKQLVLENQARIEKIFSQITEHIIFQKNVNSMFYKIVEGFQKDVAEFRSQQSFQDTDSGKRNADDSSLAEQIADLKKRVSGDESSEAAKLMRMMQKIESFENRLKNDEMRDDDLEKKLKNAKSAISYALECKTTVLEKDIRRLSGNVLPLKSKLSSYETHLKSIMESEKLDVTELAKRFESLSSLVEDIANSLEGEKSESSKRIDSVKKNVYSIKNQLVKHQDKVAEQLQTDFSGKLKDLRLQLSSVQKSLPSIKTKLSMHEKKLLSLESGEKADVLDVTGRLDDIQKTLSSILNELDREEKKTNERFKSLRRRISASKVEIEGKIRVNVSDLDSRIKIITKTIPAIHDELGMHDKELKDLIACENLDIQKITGTLSSFKIDLDRLGKKLDSGQKILVLDLRNRLSHMELSLSDTLKSQSRFVEKEIDTVAMHIPQLKSKLSVHENQFRKLIDSQRVSSQKFSENIEKLSSTIENEETISSSRIQSLKGRIESINTDLRKLHKDNFNVIDNEIKDSVSSLRSDIKELGANMPVIKSRLLKHDSDLANIMKRETFDVRLLAGRLENLASEIDEIDKKQEEYEINSAKSVMELRKNILLLLDDLKREDLKKFSSIDESIKSSVSQVRKEIENVFSQIPSIRNELSEYITELRILSESKDSDTKQILDKFSELSSNLVLLSSRVKDDENEESERIGHLKSRVLEIRDELQNREKKDISVLGGDIRTRIDSVKKEMDTISDNVPELRNKISSISSALDTAVTSETYDVGELSGRLEDFHRELKHDEIKSYSQVDSLRKQIVSVKETLRIDMQEQAKTLSQRIDSFADELPEIKSALKSHAKDIRMLTEKESFDVKTLSGKLDGIASELAGFERLTHDSFLELRGHINDVNHDMISNLTRSISIVRTEINDVKNKVPELSKKISQIDKSLLDLSKTETTDISLAFEKFQSLSDSLDFVSEVFMKKTSDNSRKIKELKKHTESLNTSLELKVDSNRETLARVISSKVKMLSKDIDSVALSIIPFKDDLMSQKRRLENLSKTDKLDFRQLKTATKSLFNQIGSMEHRVLADEMTNSKCIEGMRGKIKNSKSALEKDIRLQALALKKSIGSVSEKIPSLRERIDNDRKDLDAMLKKEKISIKGLSSILSSVESELYEVDTESSKRVDNLKESISIMRKQLFKKHCNDMDHLEKNVSDKMSVIHNEIERVGDFIPGIRESISKNEYLLKQLRDKEKIDISQVLALTDNLNSDIDAVETRLSDQKADYNSKLKNLKIKMGDIRSDMDDSLRLQAKSLQKEIDTVSSRFPLIKKELSVHSSRLKSIMSKEQIDFKDLNNDLNRVLGTLNQTTSELHGEERKSKTHFETLRHNIVSMQDRLLHKQETADKELNDSLKEQGKRLGSDIDTVSSRFPLIKKELSIHSSRLKSIMSKEQIDFKDLNNDLNRVLGTLNQTTSELHGEERKSKGHFESLQHNIVSMQ
ncbi:hypothetical protein GQ472_05005, partial [archaeon]|nr:hypothetical protein [archaeon]